MAQMARAFPLDQRSGNDLMEAVAIKVRMSEMILSPAIASRLERLIAEQRIADRIQAAGLSPRRKLLLAGPPGCGKTMTAAAIAGSLKLPFYRARSDRIVSSYLGETAKNLRTLFEFIAGGRGVYLFDEFDSIASARGDKNEMREMDRTVNSLLQMIEQDESTSILIAATNLLQQIDPALFRRFDDVICYAMPAGDEMRDLVQSRLGAIGRSISRWPEITKAAAGLCHAEVGRACDEARKIAIVEERPFRVEDLLAAIAEIQGWRPQPESPPAKKSSPRKLAAKSAEKESTSPLFGEAS